MNTYTTAPKQGITKGGFWMLIFVFALVLTYAQGSSSTSAAGRPADAAAVERLAWAQTQEGAGLFFDAFGDHNETLQIMSDFPVSGIPCWKVVSLVQRDADLDRRLRGKGFVGISCFELDGPDDKGMHFTTPIPIQVMQPAPEPTAPITPVDPAEDDSENGA